MSETQDPKLAAVLAYMDSVSEKGKIEIKDLDFLLEALREKNAVVDELEEQVKEQNKVIARIKGIIGSVLKDLDRADYKGPAGSIKVVSRTQVKMPQTPEEKELLWNWMREKGIYDRYATVHATALKSLFEAELEIAKSDPEFDPVTFALPGMAPATFFEDVRFTQARK
jgi:hypothetical protein